MRKAISIILLTVLFASYIGLILAADMIWTPNTVTTNGHHYELGPLTVNNTSPLIGDTIKFTGTLLYDDQGTADKWVILYNSTDSATWNECAQAKTNSIGYYTIDYVYPNVTVPVHWKGGYQP